MDEFSSKLNALLTGTFNSILKVEEEVIKHANDIPLTVSELHLIEAIGSCPAEKNTISDLSGMLAITMSSVTIAVNKLIKKGFVIKEKNPADGRSVHISLSERGKQMDAHHTYFHEQMVAHISDELTDDEKASLTCGIEKLLEFFKR